MKMLKYTGKKFIFLSLVLLGMFRGGEISLNFPAFFLPKEALAAQSPFGVGVATPETPLLKGEGVLAQFQRKLYSYQLRFRSELIRALDQFKTYPNAGFVLILLSLLYGIFHAAGPGHGKLVISSYVLAHDSAVGQGIFLSCAASCVQAFSAIALISSATLFLKLTSFGLTKAEEFIEILSYAAVSLLGMLLLWRGLSRRFLRFWRNWRKTPQMQAHNDNAPCCGGQGKLDPHLLQMPLSLRSALPLVMAVGIRPCTGALFILVLAYSQNLFWIGILSCYAMALGTAFTTSLISSVLVGTKNSLQRFAGHLTRGGTKSHSKTVLLLAWRLFQSFLELGGALFITFFGVSFLLFTLERLF